MRSRALPTPRRLAARRVLGAILLGALVWVPACGDGPAPPRPPNLVLIVIDTLRADAALPPGRGGWGAMPFLESLAARGVRFTNAAAPAPWTAPSIVSLLTGLLPENHGCVEPRAAPRIPEAIVTAAEYLRDEHGYRTAGFFAGPWIGPGDSILQGFERGSMGFFLQGTPDAVGPWLSGLDRDRPFFLVLHTFEAHDPYGERNHPYPPPRGAPPEPGGPPGAPLSDREVARRFMLDAGARFALARDMGPSYLEAVMRYIHSGHAADPEGPALAAELRREYEAGVRWVDGLLASTVGWLEERGLLEGTVLAVTSDHGEAFGEHGILEHGRDLHEELVRVPLVVLGPGPFASPRVVEESVGLIDILPTFLDLAGLGALPGSDGRSFLPVLAGEEPGRVVLSQDLVNRRNTGEDLDQLLLAARTERWKGIVTADRRTGTVSSVLHDLGADPGEARDLMAAPALPADIETRFIEAFGRLRESAERWAR